MFDFRTASERKTGDGYVAHCETCGHDSIIGIHHKRYCPICGPGTVANVSFTKLDGKTAGEMHRVRVSYEMAIMGSAEYLLDDDKYADFLEGKGVYDTIRPDMNKCLSEAVSGRICPRYDYCIEDIDTDKVLVDWDD